MVSGSLTGAGRELAWRGLQPVALVQAKERATGQGTAASPGVGAPGRGGSGAVPGKGSGAGRPAGGGKSGMGRDASDFLDFFPLRRPTGLTSSQGMETTLEPYLRRPVK